MRLQMLRLSMGYHNNAELAARHRERSLLNLTEGKCAHDQLNFPRERIEWAGRNYQKGVMNCKASVQAAGHQL